MAIIDIKLLKDETEKRLQSVLDKIKLNVDHEHKVEIDIKNLTIGNVLRFNYWEFSSWFNIMASTGLVFLTISVVKAVSKPLVKSLIPKRILLKTAHHKIIIDQQERYSLCKKRLFEIKRHEEIKVNDLHSIMMDIRSNHLSTNKTSRIVNEIDVKLMKINNDKVNKEVLKEDLFKLYESL
jgi:hypothetical protein